MSEGKKFEAEFKQACIEQNIDYTRLKDSGWQGETTTRRFTVKNICDCILFKNGVILFAELKHRKGALRFDEITQLDDLEKKWKPSEGVFSGVVAKLKGIIYFIPTEQILLMRDHINKKSFNAGDAEEYGYKLIMFKPKGKRKERALFSELMEWVRCYGK